MPWERGSARLGPRPEPEEEDGLNGTRIEGPNRNRTVSRLKPLRCARRAGQLSLRGALRREEPRQLL